MLESFKKSGRFDNELSAALKTDSQVSKKTGKFDNGQAKSDRASENMGELNGTDMKASEDQLNPRRSMSEFNQASKPKTNSFQLKEESSRDTSPLLVQPRKESV